MTDQPKRSDQLTDQERGLLKPYLSDVDASVFTLENLNPEVIGGALARYSRAPTGFKETIVFEQNRRRTRAQRNSICNVS